MKSFFDFGRTIEITETQEESVQILNEMLAEHNLPALKESEIRDWGIRGGETNAQLQEWVNDFVSELHTEKCEAKNAWRYET